MCRKVFLQAERTGASVRFCDIKIHEEMAKELQVKISSFYIHLCMYVYDTLFFCISSLSSLILLINY